MPTYSRRIEIRPTWPLPLQEFFDLWPGKIVICWELFLNSPSPGIARQCGCALSSPVALQG